MLHYCTWLFAGGFLALAAIITLIVINRGRSNNTIRPAVSVNRSVRRRTFQNRSKSSIQLPAGMAGPPTLRSPPSHLLNAAKAKKHQEEWAAYLKVPVEWENSIGMKFRLIRRDKINVEAHRRKITVPLSQGKIPDGRRLFKQKRLTRLVLTRPVYIAVHETTQEN